MKPADAERAAKVAARQAEIEANKAARAAELKALTDARIAKAAEAKALIEAKKAERAAAIKAEADARAAKLAEIKAANAAKSATKVTVSKPASAPKAAKPDRKAPITAKPVAKAEAMPAFELGLSLRLDAKWDLVMQNALRDAAKAATQQLEALLQISAEVDQKTRRVLENDKRRLARVVDRAIGSALARLLEPSDLSLRQLQLNAEGTRLIAPTKKLAETAFGKAKILATYKDLVALIGQPNTLQQLGLKKSEIVLNFGDSLPGNYFFSGSFKLTIDRERSNASKVEQSFHPFGKQGKTLGVQMKVSFGHDLAGNSYSGQLEADFPVSKAEA
ncbi:MAG TPA: hypothetical protein VHS96_01105 [Bacteroidia bacterium]|nr:hypothetical protein [Bacteroidia bacterium]